VTKPSFKVGVAVQFPGAVAPIEKFPEFIQASGCEYGWISIVDDEYGLDPIDGVSKVDERELATEGESAEVLKDNDSRRGPLGSAGGIAAPITRNLSERVNPRDRVEASKFGRRIRWIQPRAPCGDAACVAASQPALDGQLFDRRHCVRLTKIGLPCSPVTPSF
jgi:hypothetical protein